MKITVFTPTYNRGYIIENLYRSLQKQTFHDFEWVVVDDGSTDNTEELFAQFSKEQDFFPIRYVKTENGGKHRAINVGVSMAVGELFYIVDSDDYLPDDALQTIAQVESTIVESEKTNFAGICGIKAYQNAQAIGSSFQGDVLDITMLERAKYGISGDKAEAFYTDVLKKYPFPVFEGEKFITECVVWDKIAFDGYKLRFFNKAIMICEYLPDGLSAKGDNLFIKNPKGYGLFLHQCDVFGKYYGVRKWNEYLSYYYRFRRQLAFREIAANLHISPIVLWFRLLGLKLFYKIYDR